MPVAHNYAQVISNKKKKNIIRLIEKYFLAVV